MEIKAAARYDGEAMAATTYVQLKKFGAAIRAARLEREISQEDFAEMANIDRTYMSQIEGGKVNVSFQYITRISRALRMRTSELWAAAGQ